MSRSRLRIPDALQAMAELAHRRKWRISLTNSGHLRWQAPDGAVVFTPSTPSCSRGVRNCRAQLRRAGLKETS